MAGPNSAARTSGHARARRRMRRAHNAESGEGGGGEDKKGEKVPEERNTHVQNPGLATGPSAMVVSMSKITPAAPPCMTPL